MGGADGQLAGREQDTVVADRDGVIRAWGSRCEAILGYSAEEAIGSKVDLIIPSALRSRHWQGFHRAMETAELQRAGATLKVPAVHKSGAIVPVVGTLQLNRGDDGTADGVTLTGFDRGEL